MDELRNYSIPNINSLIIIGNNMHFISTCMYVCINVGRLLECLIEALAQLLSLLPNLPNFQLTNVKDLSLSKRSL